MKLSEKYKNMFESQIISRGREYFKNDEVIRCLKTDEGYISKVNGNYGNEYTVKIEESGDKLEMYCTCPYQDNCKHEYATLLAIDNNKYKEINLLPEILNEGYNVVDFIKAIPSEELKEYILKQANMGSVFITEEFIKEYFIKYLPKENKEYFYNTIYNNCIIENDLPKELINEYLNKIRIHIDQTYYNYAFIIIEAIIDAIYDSKIEVSTETLIEIYSKLGVFIRISYRKGDNKLKEEINNFIDKYYSTNYNNDVYLEDMLMTIK